MDVLWIALVMITLAAAALMLIVYRLSYSPVGFDVAGIWLNESKNMRILLYDIDSEFQGSVVWANGADKLLGFKVVENLKFGKSKKGKGKYSDPITGQQYDLFMQLKRKGSILIKAYLPNSESLAFSQEWKLFVS